MENKNTADNKAVFIAPNTNLNDLSESQPIITLDYVDSKTLMQKTVLDTPLYKTLLDQIDIIDFEFVASKGKIADLRQKISECSDQKLIVQLERFVKGLMLNEDAKNVIIVRRLLYLAEE